MYDEEDIVTCVSAHMLHWITPFLSSHFSCILDRINQLVMILGDEISRLISTKLTLIKKQINKIINNVEAEDIYSCKQIKSSLPYTRELGLCFVYLHFQQYFSYIVYTRGDISTTILDIKMTIINPYFVSRYRCLSPNNSLKNTTG